MGTRWRAGSWLQFVVAPNAEYVGLAAGGGADQAEQIIVLGPSRITDLAVHEIDLALDALQARRSADNPGRRRRPPPDLDATRCDTPRLLASIRALLPASTVEQVPLVRPKSG